MPDIIEIKKEIKTLSDVKNITRVVKSQVTLDATNNKSRHSLKDRNVKSGSYFGKNYCYCDFENCDLSGCKFTRCNFSFAINLDKAITDDTTEFIECNLSGADLPAGEKINHCNTHRFTDKDIEEMFKELE